VVAVSFVEWKGRLGGELFSGVTLKHSNTQIERNRGERES
jgi:hypothetical protein